MMRNRMNKKYKGILWWQAVLLLAAFFTAICKIYIGMDHDESYIVVMGIRLLNGDRMFDTMWDLHMTSAWPAWLGTELFYRVTGSVDGLVVFLRILSVILQFAVAYIVYRILKKYFAQESAFLAAIVTAAFLPRATQNLEYGLLEMLFIILTSVLIYDVIRQANDGGTVSWWKIVISAILFSVAVLAYPTIILAFPVYLVAACLLLNRKNAKWQVPLVFAGVCAICAGIFLVYILSYLSVPELLANIQGILSDGTHAEDGRMYSYGTQMLSLGKRSVMFLGICAAGYFCMKKWFPQKENILFYLLAVPTAVLVVSNVTGIRPSGPIGLQVRYLLAAVSGLVLYFAGKKKDRVLFWLFMLPGFAVYLGVMFGSNMGIEENASFLYLDLIAVVLLFSEYIIDEKKGRLTGIYPDGGKYNVKWNQGLQKICLITFAAGVLFTRGYFVRITGTGPANITEHRVQMTDGVLAGIYVYPEEAENYEEKEREIRSYSDSHDTILYLGGEALCNTFTEGQFTSATCISTPVFNEEWVAYYENEKHPQPTVVFVDKENVKNLEDFLQTTFGRFLVEKYGINPQNVVEEEKFYIAIVPSARSLATNGIK